MFGAILSTFNGVLNSSTTLFALNVYKPLFGQGKTDEERWWSEPYLRRCGAIISVCIAPFIMYAPEGLFQYLQMVAKASSACQFLRLYLLVMSLNVSTLAAKVTLVVFVAHTPQCNLVFKTPIRCLHQLAILFVVCTAYLFIIGYFMPREDDYVMPVNENIDVTP